MWKLSKKLTLNRKLPLSKAAFCAYSHTGRRRPTADAGLLAIVSLLSTANTHTKTTDLHHNSCYCCYNTPYGQCLYITTRPLANVYKVISAAPEILKFTHISQQASTRIILYLYVTMYIFHVMSGLVPVDKPIYITNT